MPCPPPYLYGVLAMALPARMIWTTARGADAGGTARPSGPIVARLDATLTSIGATASPSYGPAMAAVGSAVAVAVQTSASSVRFIGAFSFESACGQAGISGGRRAL